MRYDRFLKLCTVANRAARLVWPGSDRGGVLYAIVKADCWHPLDLDGLSVTDDAVFRCYVGGAVRQYQENVAR